MIAKAKAGVPVERATRCRPHQALAASRLASPAKNSVRCGAASSGLPWLTIESVACMNYLVRVEAALVLQADSGRPRRRPLWS